MFTMAQPRGAVKPRRYTGVHLSRRPEETRRRIVEAAVRLHTTTGPAWTTISAIAAQAGVQRLTVYRHFPEEKDLFRACVVHGWESFPPPDPRPWASIANPEQRLRFA